MTNFDYNRDIPDAPNNPSDDQPLMKTNTNSIQDLINVDHVGFKQNNGGYHLQSRYIDGGLPGGLFAGLGTVYTKLDSNNRSQLFYSPDATGNEYQLTQTDNVNFGTFRVNPGWSFLPGGVVINWGVVNGSHAGAFNQGDSTTGIGYPGNTYAPIVFSKPYGVGVFTITTTLSFSGTPPAVASTSNISPSLITNTGFEWAYIGANSNKYTSFFWVAIGL